MIPYDVQIRLHELDPRTARTAIEAHHRLQPYSGDFFMSGNQLDARHLAIDVDGKRAGVAAVKGDLLAMCTITAAAARYDRQILQTVLDGTGATQAYVASWDHHHVNLFGNFARAVDNQAYQFELLRPSDLRPPLEGLALDPAVETDLEYLHGTGFQDDYTSMLEAGELRIARLDGAEVGIGVAAPQPLGNGRIDIGMFTNPQSREKGIGRSILGLVAQEVLASGRLPTAGCWWRNWESRRTLEAAGLTCVGTIFRLELDPDRFREP